MIAPGGVISVLARQANGRFVARQPVILSAAKNPSPPNQSGSFAALGMTSALHHP